MLRANSRLQEAKDRGRYEKIEIQPLRLNNFMMSIRYVEPSRPRFESWFCPLKAV